MKWQRFFRTGTRCGIASAGLALTALVGCTVEMRSQPVMYGYGRPAPVRVVYAPHPVAAAPPDTAAADAADPATEEAIQTLVAPIALYPDPLLGEVLPAATFPQQVADANAWLQANPTPNETDIDNQPWDPSVQALVHYPTVLAYMTDNAEWTAALGEAFNDDQPAVMQAVQDLRAAASAQGNLVDTPQQDIIRDGADILIEPADATQVFVPTYTFGIYTGPGSITFGDLAFVAGAWLVDGVDWANLGVFVGPWYDWHAEWAGGPGAWHRDPGFRHDLSNPWHRTGAPLRHFDSQRIRDILVPGRTDGQGLHVPRRPGVPTVTRGGNGGTYAPRPEPIVRRNPETGTFTQRLRSGTSYHDNTDDSRQSSGFSGSNSGTSKYRSSGSSASFSDNSSRGAASHSSTSGSSSGGSSYGSSRSSSSSSSGSSGRSQSSQSQNSRSSRGNRKASGND